MNIKFPLIPTIIRINLSYVLELSKCNPHFESEFYIKEYSIEVFYLKKKAFAVSNSVFIYLQEPASQQFTSCQIWSSVKWAMSVSMYSRDISYRKISCLTLLFHLRIGIQKSLISTEHQPKHILHLKLATI